MLSRVSIASLPKIPFRGLRSFRYADHPIFFARENETRKLLRLVTIYRGVLLYGDSGTGKSSLINAGLIPQAIHEGFSVERLRVHPRINEEFVVERLKASDCDPSAFLPSRLTSDNESPRIVFSAEELLGRLQSLSPGRPLILVFDQFEEWVTQVDQNRQGEALNQAYQAQDRILETLVSILRDPSLPVKLLFVFREDYLAKLSPLFRQCPDLANNHLRLTSPPLSVLPKIIRGAFESCDPDHTHWKSEISPALAESIQQQLESRGRNTINLSEIQVVCLRLWQSRDPERLFAQRQISGILEDFLANKLSRLGPLEGAAIALLSELVTISGTRNIVSHEDLIDRARKEAETTKAQLLNALNVLVEGTKLVSKELRNDTYFYEIVSEFLVPWILQKKIQLNEKGIRARLLRRIRYAIAVFLLCTIASGFWFYQRNSEVAQRHNLVVQLMHEKGKLEKKKLELEQSKQDLDRLLKAMVNKSDDAFKQEAYRQLTGMQAKLDGIEKAMAESRQLNIDLALQLKKADMENHDLSARLKQFESRTQELLSKIKQLETRRTLTDSPWRSDDPLSSPVPAPVVSTENEEDTLAIKLTKEAQQTLEKDSDLSIWLSLYAFKAAKSQPIREYAEVALRTAVWKAQALPVFEVAEGKAHFSEIAFSPDGTKIVTVESSHPKIAEVWDINSGRRLTSITVHGNIMSVVFSPDNRILATGTDEGIASFWELQSGSQIKMIRAREEIDHISFSSNGQLVALAGHSHETQPTNSLNIRRFISDQPLVISREQEETTKAEPGGGDANSTRVWDLNSPRNEPASLVNTVYGEVTEISFSPGGTFLGIGTQEGGVILGRLAPGDRKPNVIAETTALKGRSLANIKKVVFSQDERKIAVLDTRGVAAAWDIHSKPYVPLALSNELMGKIKEIAFDSNGRLVVANTYHKGQKLVIRDGQTGERIDHSDPNINAGHAIIKFSDDTKLLAISDEQRRQFRIYPHDAGRLASLAERYVHRRLTSAECGQYLQKSDCPPLP